jgi:hypothetical protein
MYYLIFFEYEQACNTFNHINIMRLHFSAGCVISIMPGKKLFQPIFNG